MRSIEIQILNPGAVHDSLQAMQVAARLTQRGETIETLEDFETLYRKPLDKQFIENLCELPHPTLQKFGVINVVVVGLSRRALAQITRHQNEVKFMSSSLQYSDYSDAQRFVFPPGIDAISWANLATAYEMCADIYDVMIRAGCTPDQAGYVMPQGLKGVLMISATPYQWKHMIGQRVCLRNTAEVRYIFLKIWERLNNISPELFGDAGPGCLKPGGCQEGKMACGLGCMSLDQELVRLEDEH